MAEPVLIPGVPGVPGVPGAPGAHPAPGAQPRRSSAAARVRVMVRLRFVVLWNTVRRHPWQLVGAIIGALYGLGLFLGASAGLVALGFGQHELARTVLVLAGAAVVLGWAVGPILSTGMDRTLDPARLASIPMSPSVQLSGIAAASLCGIPGLVTLLLAVVSAVAWFRSPGAAVIAVVLAPVAALTCVLACQLVVTLLARATSNRRFREVIGGLLLLVLVLIGPLINGIREGVESIGDRLPQVAEAVSWTPLGAVWAVAADAANGSWLSAGAKALIALATPVALFFAWRALFLANLGSESSGSQTKTRAGTGWLGRFPATPRGAIAARALTYWLRDPRYLQSLIVVLLMPVLFGFVAGSTGAPIMLAGSTVIVAALLSLSTFTDISYDGTAFTAHVLRGVRGIDDRLGRIWANAIVGVPLILVIAVVTTAIVGRFDQLPTLLGLTAVVTLGGFGTASVCSAIFVMPVPQAGENPFASKPGAGMLSLAGMAGSYGALTVLSLPTIVCVIVAAVSGQALWTWITLIVGVVTGAAAFWGGVRWGAAIFDRRAPELLASVTAQA